MATSTDRKSTIGLEKLVMWEMTADTSAAITYSETAHAFEKALMTASDTPSVIEANNDSDNQVTDTYTASNGGELGIGLTGTNSDDTKALYGEKVENGTNVTNKDDIAPYQCVAFMTKKTNGLVNLYKYPKTKFSPQAITYETVKKGGVTFAQENIKGIYEPTINSGDSRYIRKNVDPVADAAVITGWFGTADYTGPEGA